MCLLLLIILIWFYDPIKWLSSYLVTSERKQYDQSDNSWAILNDWFGIGKFTLYEYKYTECIYSVVVHFYTQVSKMWDTWPKGFEFNPWANRRSLCYTNNEKYLMWMQSPLCANCLFFEVLNPTILGLCQR